MRILSGFTMRPRNRAIGATLALLLLSVPVQADQLNPRVSLKGPFTGVPIRVPQASPVTMDNDGERILHQTTITRMQSGARLAQISTIYAGQKYNLEFSQEGAYSICFFLSPETLPAQERCLFLDVVTLRTAHIGSLLAGPLS